MRSESNSIVQTTDQLGVCCSLHKTNISKAVKLRNVTYAARLDLKPKLEIKLRNILVRKYQERGD